MEVCEVVDGLIKKRGWKKIEFAEKFIALTPRLKSTNNVPSIKSVYAYLIGTRHFEVELLPYIAKTLDVSIQDLFPDAEENKEKIVKQELAAHPAKYHKDLNQLSINGIPTDLTDFVNDFLSLDTKEQEMYYYEIKAKAMRNKT